MAQGFVCPNSLTFRLWGNRPMHMGPYTLLEVVGKGGMGTVYRGQHTETGQVVAVKVMAPELASDPVLLKRFRQEFSAANRLRHPHVVQGLSFGLEGNVPYLVMEFVDGQNLRQCVQEQGPFTVDQAVQITLQVADALELAHQIKLVHRDVKPENILLTRGGQAKLTDLGLIKDVEGGTDLTRTRTTLGTAVFMAPEQYEGARHADARCDVYGLAATLYFLLTGVAPFQGRGSLSILHKKLQNDFHPPSRIVPSLPGPIDRAICQALQAKPEGRPGSCREFAALLTRPDAAAGPGAALAKEQRTARRYPVALGASCAPLQGGNQWCGEILDISLTGIHLQLDRRFEPNAVLKVDAMDEATNLSATWLVRVRWVRQMDAQQWSVGCAFNKKLTEEELDIFLDNLPPTAIVQEGG